MSIAGTRSGQGDEYQLRVALHWSIRLLSDPSIIAVQAESTGLPGEGFYVRVDDVVILFFNGRRIFIQAKKNQTEHSTWTLRDRVLQAEILKARDQLEGDPRSEVYFYSQTPFGDFQRLAESAKSFPDHQAFVAEESRTRQELLAQFARIVERDHPEALRLCARIHFGPAHTLAEWDRLNLADLDRVVPHSLTARTVLEELLRRHQTKLRDAPFLLHKEDVTSALAEHGLYLAAPYSEAETINLFRTASAIGREWIRTIDGEHLRRPEVDEIWGAISENHQSVLLIDRPGGGKTCVLLDLADEVSRDPGSELLFIKADLFAKSTSEDDLQSLGMPDDIVGRCARLSAYRRVIVIIDSLDVLSLHRNHGSLRLFLGLMDRLQTIPGVTVVAACRDFDLHYDLHLRGRTWAKTVALAPLNFQSQVVPLLSRWNVDPVALSEELQNLLRVPQHLRVFERLTRNRTPELGQLASAYQLYQRYLEEVVAADSLLGHSALEALAWAAEWMIEQRSLTISKAQFVRRTGEMLSSDPDQLVQRLISQQVLSEPISGVLSFSHQTLLDCLAVHGALSRGETLLDFIRGKRPVPFIRPTIRVFFFYLRAHEPSRFRQQVRAVLSEESLAYHLRRLVAESLAEIIPSEDDWPLLRWLVRTYADLFSQMLGQTRGEAWLQMLTSHLLPSVRGEPELKEQWLFGFAMHLKTWATSHAEQVVALWREMLDEFAADFNAARAHFTCNVLIGLEQASIWRTEGMRGLLEAFLNEPGESDRHYLGRALSSFIRATGEGDDLLWRFLNPPAESTPLPLDYDSFSGDEVTFASFRFKRGDIPDGFLKERLASSDWLLDHFIHAVLPASVASEDRTRLVDADWLPAGHLGNTSYRRRRSRRVIMPYGSEHFIQDVLEEALKVRATRDDRWWREHEPELRHRRDLGVRYLLVQAYRENPEANAVGVAVQLCDRELLREWDLDYELGELTRDAYPYLPEDAQERHQRLVLSLYADDRDGNDWIEFRARKTYELLQWVPRWLRLREAQEFLDTWEPRFGPARPERRLHMWDGNRAPPLSVEELLALTPAGARRLIDYFQGLAHAREGGRDEYMEDCWALRRIFRNAATIAPVEVLNLIDELTDEGIEGDYVDAVASGVSSHLSYRFGNVRPAGDWTPREPLPEGEELAVLLLDFLDRHPSIWSSRDSASEIAAACAHVVLDPDAISRLTEILYILCQQRQTPDAAAAEDRDKHGDRRQQLSFDALNNPRGVTANASVRFCNHLADCGKQMPERVKDIIWTFAADPEAFVRVAVLENLAYTVSACPEIGWPALDIVLKPDAEKPRATPPHLWRYIEDVLYYNYYHRYERVAPLLERLRTEAFEIAGETYGRISTLSLLAGHTTAEDIFRALSNAPAGVWKGTAQVLCGNIGIAAHRTECRLGILRLLGQRDLPPEAADHIAYAFSGEESSPYLTAEIALALVNYRQLHEKKAKDGDRAIRLSGVVDWLVIEASRDPLSSLRVIERLVDVLAQEGRMALYNVDEMVVPLSAALREADELDDQALLLRVLAVQDKLLRLGISEMNDFLNQAARP